MTSYSVNFLIEYVLENSKKNWELLDIGCGDGTVVRELHNKGYDILGTDITLKYIKEDKNLFFEYPCQNMNFKDNEFDFTFSSDFLEHIPTKSAKKCVKEIIRITKLKTYHIICNKWTDWKLHRTTKPLSWWQKIFDEYNTKNIDIKLKERIW